MSNSIDGVYLGNNAAYGQWHFSDDPETNLVDNNAFQSELSNAQDNWNDASQQLQQINQQIDADNAL